MESHALAVLETAESWNWPLTQRVQRGGKYSAVAPKLLSSFITESKALGGTLLDEFWFQLGECHPKLKENIEQLKCSSESVSSDGSSASLFEGVEQATISFDPIYEMAADIFTHLGVERTLLPSISHAPIRPNTFIVTNTSGRKRRDSTPNSNGDITGMVTKDLAKLAKEEPSMLRKQEALKSLVFRRDGELCVLTGMRFNGPSYTNGVNPVLAEVIPQSVRGKSETLRYLAMFAGEKTRDLVLAHLDGICNLISLSSNAYVAFNESNWGMEAHDDNGKTTYVYRRIPKHTQPGPGFVRLRDGDEIHFGEGPDGESLGGGPLPLLCNLRLAVARALKTSGAAELLVQLREDADDAEFPQVFIASEDFCNILTAKLLLISERDTGFH